MPDALNPSPAAVDRYAVGLSPKQRRLLELMLEKRVRQKAGGEPHGGERSTGDREERTEVIPRRPAGAAPLLSFAQQRLWFIQQLQPESAAYNIPSGVRLRGPLDVGLFAESLRRVARRQDLLRTTYELAGQRPEQVVDEALPSGLPLVDLRRLDASRREEVAQDAVDRLARTPFDLAAAPPWRAVLVRTRDDDHVFLAVMHHILSDTWTTGVFFREMVAHYQHLKDATPLVVPELPVQYLDYALWQRETLAGGPLREQIAYWQQKFAGAPELLDLPTDRPRPNLPSYRGGRINLQLPNRLTDRLKTFSAANGATLFMAFMAGFQALLYRYTHQRDVLVGTPMANRTRTELENLVGLFVNTLVLRTRFFGDPSFRELLGQVRENTLEGLSNHDVPFEKVVEELTLERDTSRNPLFQALFAFQNVPIPRLVAEGLTLERFEFRETTARLDLELDLQEMPWGFVGWLGYNSDLFDPTTAGRLAQSFRLLLTAIVDQPEMQLFDLPVLRRPALHQLLIEWRASRSHTVTAPIPALFTRQVRRRPEAVAVVGEERRWSYGELDRRARLLGRRLAQSGVGPEARVALCLEREPEMMVAVLAVTLAGGAYLPLDPAAPPDRLAFIVGDAGARVLVTRGELARRCPQGCELVDLDELRWGEAQDGKAELPEVDLEHLAYVLYTSGSTGRPKGVLVTQRQVVRLLSAVEEAYSPSPDDVWPLFHSYCFDVSVWEMWGALLYGGTLVTVPYWVSRSPGDFWELLVRERLTFLNQTPTAFRQLRRAALRGERATALREIVLAGEALLPPTLEPWFERYGDGGGRRRGPRLVNMYGPTETTVYATFRPITRSDLETEGRSPIGVALPDLEILVLSPRSTPVPVGVAGELVIGGPGLARGYLGRAGLTAVRFVPHPWSAEPGARLYRSGDLARQLGDGSLEYLGRIDRQVKLRGFRIELGEIEAMLAQLPEVAEAVVQLYHAGVDSADRAGLAAYVVAAPGVETGGSRLRQVLAEKLPDYMVPSSFVMLEALPTTPSGKVDRRALPAPEAGTAPRPSAAGSAPRSELERTLATIWKRVLGVEEIGITASFFDVGGNSLLLAQVHEQLAEHGFELTLVDLFRYPTIRTLARFLSRGREDRRAAIHEAVQRATSRQEAATAGESDLAIIGMGFRFPGAETPEDYWHNLARGVESVRFFSRQEALDVGVPSEFLDHPSYVLAEGSITDVESFDYAFFGYSEASEVERIDPQQRIFMENAWEALERAGYDPRSYGGTIGLFGGVNLSSYLFTNLYDHDPLQVMSHFLTRLELLAGNQGDYMCTRIAYQLDLRGPVVTVQTACSTAVTAVHMACQSLLRHECDMCLAGGAQIRVPQRMGYMYEEGGFPSPDGRCRSFDAKAKGNVHGNGSGVVLLKRLADALADGDHVHAVIKGTAVANDGAVKIGYSAPGVEGQARVAAEALAVSGIHPESIGYLEASGTATELGDPLEIEALTQAWQLHTAKAGFCPIGSVKSNIGHLDAASGAAALIKTALVLEHGQIPPSLHFEEPNPNIDFVSSPFFVNTELTDFPRGESPRRAAVHTYAVGGTNVHMILEEAPARPPSEPSRSWQLLPLSARTESGLEAVAQRLTRHLEDHPEVNLADVAYTLQMGRRPFRHRRFVLCREVGEAVAQLAGPPAEAGLPCSEERGVAFLLPGQGEHTAAAAELYGTEVCFRAEIDRCAELLPDLLRYFGAEAAEPPAPEPWPPAALFAFELALAGLWEEWGVVAQATLGQGVGALVAAHLEGGLSLEVALSGAAEGDAPADRFDEGVEKLAAEDPERVLLALGPQGALDVPGGQERRIFASLAAIGPDGASARLLATLGRLWQAGVEVSWEGFTRHERRRRVPLPTYPFERTRAWVEPKTAWRTAFGRAPEGEKRTEVGSWFYVPTWQRSERLAVGDPGAGSRSWLVLADSGGLGMALATRLRELCAAGNGDRGAVTIVRPGTSYARIAEGMYIAAPGSESSYRELVESLRADGALPDEVVHLWSLNVGGGEASPLEDEVAQLGFWSQVHLLRALAAYRGADSPCRLTVVTRGAEEVTGEEELSPGCAPALAPLRVLGAEMPGFSGRSVDVSLPAAGSSLWARLVEDLSRELTSAGEAEGVSETCVAYRGRHRWLRRLEPLPLGTAAEEGNGNLPVRLRPAGVYLVAGGLGGLGLVAAEFLARTARAKLVLLAADASSGIDPGQLQKLRDLGAELLVLDADPCDRDALSAALDRAEERFGALNGVVHAAEEPRPEHARSLTELDAGWYREQLEARLSSVILLADLLADRRLDFQLLSSTLGSLIGGPLAATDGAAGAFLDLFARRRNQLGAGTWTSVDWDHVAFGNGSAAPTAITEEEGFEVLRRVLGREDLAQVAVSTVDLSRRLERAAALDKAGPPPAVDDGAARAVVHVAPRNETERRLAEVWGEVLGVDRIGVRDNFFEVGGDSVLSIQLVSRLRRAGWKVTAGEVFRHQTVEELARIARPVSGETAAEDGPVSGPVPLTPIQHWFFHRPLAARWHFNQSLLLEPREKVEPTALRRAFAQLLEHHDALRLRFFRDARETAVWRQENAARDDAVPWISVDLSGLAERWPKGLEAAASLAQKSLDLEKGPLSRMVLFELPGAEADRLLWVIHHLAVDGVSWRLLLEDLQRLVRGEELAPRTTSFQSWARRLQAHATSPELEKEAEHWLGRDELEIPSLPVDRAGENTQASTRILTSLLEPELTRLLLEEVSGTYGTDLRDVLLAALVRTFQEWTGSDSLWVDLEGHGREEELFEGVDLSRTVGWFTSLYPVLLKAPDDSGKLMKAVKEELRSVPAGGVGYGVLRWQSRFAGQVESLPAAEVVFNYLGRLDLALPSGSLFERARESTGPVVAGQGRRSHVLEIDAAVLQRGLELRWKYSDNLHDRATIGALAESFRDHVSRLAEHCRSPQAGGYTPSDFPLAGLDQETLDDLLGHDPNVEDVYPLSPLQEGLFFHALHSAAPGLYVERLELVLRGRLQPELFRRAWQAVVDRHPALRSCFVWEPLVEPVQIVRRHAEAGWEELDWRDRSAEEIAAELRTDHRSTLARGFDLSRAPLMRFTLIRSGDEEHRFVWNHHHLPLDGWSLGVIFREVLEHYRAWASGGTPELEPVRPYREFIAWLASSDPSPAESFWRRWLAGFKTPTLVSGVLSRAAEKEGARSEIGGPEFGRAVLPGTLISALEALASRHRLTLHTLVQGAWSVLLSRCTGVRDVLFGVTVAGRPAELPGVESMVGPFINTLPMRVDVASEARLPSWMKRLQNRQSEWLQHQLTPLQQIRGWSEVASGELFDHLLIFENYPLDSGLAHSLAGLTFAELKAFEYTHYPLAIVVVPAERWELRFQWAGGFERTSVLRMMSRLRHLLHDLAERPESRLRDLEVLSAPERHQLRGEWNDTARHHDLDAGVYQIFEERAAADGDAVAVTFEERAISYRELGLRAAAAAARLRGAGAGAEDLLAILAQRSPEFLISILAALRVGAAYLPLDPRHPPLRLRQALSESRCVLVAVTAAFEEVLAEAVEGLDPAPRAARLEELAAAGPGDATPPFAVDPQQLAYVIYTSGSTGAPKGAMVNRRGMLNHLAAKIADLGLTRGDRVAQTASQCFDISVWQFLAALLVGGRVQIYGDRVAHDPDALLALADGEGITVLETVPSLMQPMLRPIEDPVSSPHRLAALRWLIPTGEALPPQLVREWQALHPEAVLVNAYGPTECSDDVSHFRIRGPVRGAQTSIPIGRPVVNTRLHVVDPRLETAPLGITGELCVAGDGVGRGYLRRPARTAAAFVPDPWAEEAGDRLYRSGDLARFLPAGDLDFLGRIDHQVKIRGSRIEMGEIEAALVRQAEIRQAAVLAREDRPGELRLVAYVVQVPEGEAVPGSELRRRLGRELPEPMIPWSFVTLHEMPLTPNGKVDRKALPAPVTPAAGERPHQAPRAGVEEALAGIWEEVLKVEAIGRESHFFELGGDSISTIQVISRARRAGWDLEPEDLFLHPTLEELAAVARRHEPSAQDAQAEVRPMPASPETRAGDAVEPDPDLLPIARAPRGHAPLSFAQERLWFIERLDPDKAVYNIPFAIRFRGPLEDSVLTAALYEVIHRHEVLRTTFSERRGEAVQVIAPARVPDLPRVDLSGIGGERRETLADELAATEAARPLDLERGPLLRPVLVRLASDDHLALLNIHHIVFDGWSVGIFIRELIHSYSALGGGSRAGGSLPELPLQYADFAAWQRSWLAGEVLENELAFWRRALQGAPQVLELPSDRPRPPVPSFRGVDRRFRVSGELTGELELQSQRSGVSLFMTLLAAFQAVLAQWSGQREFLVGTPSANRNRPEIEGLIGLFVNTLVMRGDLTGDASFTQLLERVRSTSLAAQAHQDLPFEKLVEDLQPERDLSRSPLFQVMFILQNVPLEHGELPGIAMEFPEPEIRTSKFDLTLQFIRRRGALAGKLEYSSDLFDTTTMRRFEQRFLHFLEGVAADPRRRLRELPLAGPAQHHQLLREWNDTLCDLDQACLQELFEECVVLRPDAVTLVFENDTLSHQELNRRANRLAHHLRELGVRPESRVAIAMERSPELVVGLLAILKAGGAYVPLDPSYPRDRLSLILEDAEPLVLLTQSRLRERLPSPLEAEVLCLDDQEGGSCRASMTNPFPAAGPDGLAYVIFTSGSTGRPKGVAVSHGAISNRLSWMQRQYRLEPGERVLQKTPYGFDVSVWEFFWPLMTGACLVVAVPEGHRDPAYLVRTIVEQRITTLHFVPAMLRSFLAEGDVAACRSLKRVIASGEALPFDLEQTFHGRLDARLENLYGPTEAAVDVTWWRTGLDPGRQTVPIGRPVANTCVLLLDPGLALVSVGATGELYLGGVQLARGYLDRPGLTAERFVPNPLPVELGGRLYRTGDLARHLPTGAIEFLGRCDHQVKIRGFRIELGEIETALSRLPEVRDAVVLAREDRPGEKRLVAYLVPVNDSVPTHAELRGDLDRTLPEYMLPSAFVTLHELPLTANGKVDRKALPAPERNGEASYVEPRTATEETLAGIWAEVLGVARVGAEDNFFDLGGHSLLASQLVSRLAREFELELPLRRIFERPTVAHLATTVDTLRWMARRPESAAGVVGDDEEEGEL